VRFQQQHLFIAEIDCPDESGAPIHDVLLCIGRIH
jgi:hypothetical protein